MHIKHPLPQKRGKAQIIVSAFIILFVFGTISVFLFLRSEAKAQKELRERLMTVATLAALQIDARELVRIQEHTFEQNTAYHTLVSQLHVFQLSIPDIRFVYVLRKAEGDDPFMLTFVADADSLKSDTEKDRNGNGIVDPEEEPSYLGDLYDASDAPSMIEAFTAPASDNNVTVDQWGSTISGYAPVKDANGDTVAILGIDMMAEDFFDHARDFFPFFGVLLFMAIGAVIGLYVGLLGWRRAEQERERTTLFYNLPGMAYRRRNDEYWTMQFLSDGCTALTGYDSSELIANKDRSYAELIHSEDRTRVWDEVQSAVRDHRSFLLSYRIRTKAGQEKWIWEHGCAVLDTDNHVSSIEGFMMDITEQKQLDVAKSQFLQAASHQLRTPISAVRWGLDTLAESQEHPLVGMQRQIVDDAVRYIIRMADTVNMMLRVSEMESGSVRLELQNVPLKQFLEEKRSECATLLSVKNQTCAVLCSDNCVTYTDPVILHEVLSILIMNASAYSPIGSEVTVDVKRNGTSVCIDIADHGCGIPRQEQHKIFTRFFRASNAAKISPEGSGLGLTLAHALVRILGGTLSFVSEEGKGSVFTVQLPCA